MKFKDFEIRESNEQDEYEVVKHTESDGHEYCCVIGYLKYYRREDGWNFTSVGLRYLQEYSDGLNEFILKYVELLDIKRKYHQKEMDEYYEQY